MNVQIITEKYGLKEGWFNYFAQMLRVDEVLVPYSQLWKRFGALYVYIPPKEYILALKIIAGRGKDLDDCAILLPQVRRFGSRQIASKRQMVESNTI